MPQGSVISADGRKLPLLDWLPWEKAVVWGLILLTFYMLRSFFFTIFMVFIVSYIVRSIVMWVQSLLSPYEERIWLERVLTLACFALLLLGMFEVGQYIGPRLRLQGKALFDRVTRLDATKEFNSILDKTVGAYLLRRDYEDETYNEKFEEFRKNDVRFLDFERFGSLQSTLLRRFETEKLAPRARNEIDSESQKVTDEDYDHWFEEEKAPRVFAADRAKWTAQWQATLTAHVRTSLRNDPTFDERQAILEMIVQDWETAGRTGPLGNKEEWTSDLIARRIVALSESEESQESFKEFFAESQERDLIQELAPYTYEDYTALTVAHEAGPEAFSDSLREIKNFTDNVEEEDLLARQRIDFEYREQQKLTKLWREGEGQQILATVTKYRDEGLTRVGAWVTKVPAQLIAIPTQLALALLLSLFITLDIAKLRRGLQKLENSRIRNFYQEIAPGLINFGRLMGRAFLAQGAIALCNTLLTFLSIKLLGIQNEYFLCAIVFLCSFIPVLGVVLSSVPIAIMALVQPGGSIWLSLYAIVAILVIHFVETSFFNPKIIGDMLHLHPVLVLAVLAIGEHFFGVWGLLLAVPVSVYIIRFVVLNEGIPGFIEPVPKRVASQLEPVPQAAAPVGQTSAPIVPGLSSSVREETAGDGDDETAVSVSSEQPVGDEQRQA